MGLNISNGSGEDFRDWVKYNAKAGRWYIKKDGNEVEIQNPTFVADFDNIKTGWMHFEAGMAPSVVLDPDLSTPAAKPTDKHKRGFEVDLFSEKAFGGVVVFSSTSAIVGAAINEVYEQYEKDKAANVNALPVVKCTGVPPEVGKHGTNYKPTLSLVKWVPRPSDFDAPDGDAKPAPQAAQAQSSVSEF